MSGRAVRPGVKVGSGVRVENIAQPRDRQPRLMKILPDLRQAQAPAAPTRPGQHVERDQFADGHIAVDDQLGAEKQHRGRHQLADQLHGLAGPVAEVRARGSSART